MSYWYLAIALLYSGLTVGLCVFERARRRDAPPDMFTAFLVIFGIQCLLPGIGIFAVLPFTQRQSPTDGSLFFDRIYTTATPADALLVFLLTLWFVAFAYIGFACWPKVSQRALGNTVVVPLQTLQVRTQLLAFIVLAGLGLSVWAFTSLGEDTFSRYTGLVQLRAAQNDETSMADSRVYVLTQTWEWLAVVLLYAVAERHGMSLRSIVTLLMLVLLAALCASRRALLIPLLLAYLTHLLRDGQWRVRGLMFATVPIIFWLAFGKELFSALAWHGTVGDYVFERYSSPAPVFLRAISEVGISVVESLGTVSLFDGPMRFGIDHVWSFVHRLPHFLVGDPAGGPARIVSLTTSLFSDPDSQDIPPGLFGQMWLDFRALGPVIWGLLMGSQVGLIQLLFSTLKRSSTACAICALLLFIVTLPVNTGSFDFTFTLDVFATLIVLLLVCRRTRLPA